DRRAGPAADELPQELHAAVLRVAEQHLVASAELERADDGVQRRARVRREDEVRRRGAEVRGERRPRRLQPRGEAALEREKLDGLPLELALQPLVLREDRTRASAERAVVQVDDAGIEQELVPQA